MIIRPYGSEKFDKPGFETFYEAVNFGRQSKKFKIKACEISKNTAYLAYVKF